MIEDKIKQDLQRFLKEGNSLEVSTLRLLLSAIQNKEKEKKYSQQQDSLSEQEIISIIQSEAKKRKESIKVFELGKRDDLVQKEKQELEILKQYLPKELSPQELQEIITKAINKSGASTIKDIGKVMAQVMPEIKGRADGATISQKIKELLE